MKSKGIAAGIAGIALAVLGAAAATAQDSFPAKPMRLIVGYVAGGGNDIIARVIAGKMAEGLGQQIIIENKPGAQSIIAAEFVAKSAPDGYTILMGPSGPMTMNPATYSKLPYAPLRDFVPLSMIGSFPLILVTSGNSPLKSVKELIEFAKADPAKSNYASSAAPFQLAAELFKLKTGTSFTHIPYKGSNESANAVMSGEVTMTISDPAPIAGAIKSGRLRALAVTSPKRHPSWPDVPTMIEAGIPDSDIVIWTGFLVPAGTPAAIVKRLQDEVARVVRLPEIRERLSGMGVDPVGNTSEEFGRIIAADIAKWTAVAKAANIRAD
jgi:tripartite-type tricarboxylate transporter receptor subunit TctC